MEKWKVKKIIVGNTTESPPLSIHTAIFFLKKKALKKLTTDCQAINLKGLSLTSIDKPAAPIPEAKSAA